MLLLPPTLSQKIFRIEKILKLVLFLFNWIIVQLENYKKLQPFHSYVTKLTFIKVDFQPAASLKLSYSTGALQKLIKCKGF